MDEITITIPREKYQFLIKTVESHRGLLEKLGVNPLVKQSLVKDVQIIRTILGVHRPTFISK